MANQLSHLLNHWHPERDHLQWVLGTVYKTEGPCYRKPGAMMLLNSLGQQYGLLSGGCLESDIQLHARKVMENGRALTLCYDGSDEDDLSFQLGIGCGGTVYILLQPIIADNNYLDLIEIREALAERQCGIYRQRIPTDGEVATTFFVNLDQVASSATLVEENDEQWLQSVVRPDSHLLVIGGGVDARPLVSLANEMGWQVSLCDPRPANARQEFFPAAQFIIRELEQLPGFCREHRVDAAVLMAHNISMDAEGLKQFQSVDLKYLAMLGPRHRQQQVINAAGLNDRPLRTAVAGPAGLNIGGELPESIALAILAECHAALHGRSGGSLSGVLNNG